jgi:ABC-type lipoprotein export system ATPase subunit
VSQDVPLGKRDLSRGRGEPAPGRDPTHPGDTPPLKRVTAHGLGHQFAGGRRLFEGLELELRAGELVAVTGPSGAGKSTLLSILAGWTAPAAGTVTRQGVSHTGWVMQNPHGVPRRTALDHVALPLLARGRSRRQAAGEARDILARFDLGEAADRLFKTLSGGEAQRLMLARAVATAFDLLLVDEPTAQLDLGTAATVNAVLAQLAQADAIVVVATHDPHTRAACDRVVDLADHQPTSGRAATPTTDRATAPTTARLWEPSGSVAPDAATQPPDSPPWDTESQATAPTTATRPWDPPGWGAGSRT